MGNKPRAWNPVHDEFCAVVDENGLARNVFAADALNQLWIVDITKHRTAEGNLYASATKDALSERFLEYSIDSRMKSRLTVQARRTPSICVMTSPAA